MPCRGRRVDQLVEVRWIPPSTCWIKCNTDGAFSTFSSLATCGIIFRDSRANMVGCLAESVVAKSALEVEVLVVIQAVQIAQDHGWMSLWIETDSLLVIRAFSYPSLVPCFLYVQWLNMLFHVRQMRLRFSHIFREGNGCADSLAGFGLRHIGYHWWSSVPSCIMTAYSRDRGGLPHFRVS
uniref:Ribonuclease H protein At1g65750 family n=1 Tax=Cajanus cajan TaxID=3821 RepID=A0A151TIW2_CAJCA|nr:Putative ribonuclease H protein At1g65750 family [Cajanus cajan]